jgi:hypothetical protein
MCIPRSIRIVTTPLAGSNIIGMKRGQMKRNSQASEDTASRRKERMTFSLSQASANFLRQRGAEEDVNLSTALDRLIEDSRRAKQLAQLNASVLAFYDLLPESAMHEDAAWGQLGAAGLASFEAEIERATPEMKPAGCK